MFSGITILMAHPRLYLGDVGNLLTPALIELPLGPNADGIRFSQPERFFADRRAGTDTANRLDEPWNQNAWARSLHFLAAWFFLAALLTYLGLGAATRHIRRRIVPRRDELSAANLREDVAAHLHLPVPKTTPGEPYSILQKLAYASVLLVALPLMFVTGITMSPAITADWPILLDLFGGFQTARTIHFFVFSFISIFLLTHLVMIVLTGPVRQLRSITIGGTG